MEVLFFEIDMYLLLYKQHMLTCDNCRQNYRMNTMHERYIVADARQRASKYYLKLEEFNNG